MSWSEGGRYGRNCKISDVRPEKVITRIVSFCGKVSTSVALNLMVEAYRSDHAKISVEGLCGV